MDQARFEQRFDIARFLLMRKYRWARRIIRNLSPVYRQGATLAVDRYYRLYYGEATEAWTDPEFVGALWHEVNHLLRKHPDRLEHFLPQLPTGMDPRTVNVAADLEINDDLANQPGVVLPPDLFYSHKVGHVAGQLAETHLREFVEAWVEEDDEDGDEDGEDWEEDEDGEQGQGVPIPGKKPQVSEGDPEDTEEGDEGDSDSDSDYDDDDEEEDGDGSNAPPSQPEFADPPPQNEGGGAPKQPEDTGLDMPECGSGSGIEDPEELPPPDDHEQARLKREERKLDEDIIDAVQNGDYTGGLPPGMTPMMHKAAVNRLVPKIDWRQQLAVELRTAFEQRADEAEEYSFRRRSRRQASFPDAILPGTFRPIPNLGVVVDISGSMNGPKVVAAMSEVKGILERLSIPVFTVYPCDTEVQGEWTVETQADIDRILDDPGGGTNMMVGLHYAADRGSEVIVCLTDMDCGWDERWLNGVPVIIGSIDGRRKAPSWARVVEVRSAAELDDSGY